MDGVKKAREAGLQVEVSIPRYEEPTWTGYQPGNPQVYMGWATPEEHNVIQTAVNVYDRVVSPNINGSPETEGALRKQARVDRWIFSTDGVGFPIPEENKSIDVSERKEWVHAGGYKHPPMFGFGPGIEQNTHKIGEAVDQRELRLAIAFLARFPSVFANVG